MSAADDLCKCGHGEDVHEDPHPGRTPPVLTCTKCGCPDFLPLAAPGGVDACPFCDQPVRAHPTNEQAQRYCPGPDFDGEVES